MGDKPIWDDERIRAWRADVIAQCKAEGAPNIQALGELPYVMMQEYEATIADLRAKLAAAKAECNELYETVAALGNQIEAMELSAAATRQDVVSLVERLLDEARDQGHRTVIWPETYSRRWLMRRLREELGVTEK